MSEKYTSSPAPGTRLAVELVPRRLGGFVRRAGATALMLQHRLVTPAAVVRAHELGVAGLAWTVVDPADIERVVEAGVDGVITNDPRGAVATLRA